MFKIGDFARLSRVPVKTLRYYDEIGLLKPHGIDRFTRYRYYSAEQLPTLYRILALKELGFSLEQITRLTAASLSEDQLWLMLQSRREEIQRQLQVSQAQLAQVDARLRMLVTHGQLPHYEVILKPVAAQWVASLSSPLNGDEEPGACSERLFTALRTCLNAQPAAPAGPGILLYHEADPISESGTRLEAALPLGRQIQAEPPVRVYQLPGLPHAAAVVHQGSLADIGPAYQAVLSWIQAGGYYQAGPVRELTLHPAAGSLAADAVTEIQIPVIKFKELKMEPKIVTRSAFKVVGLRYLGKNEHGEISAMWQEFNKRADQVRHTDWADTAAYGICVMASQGEMEYFAGLPVTELKDIPADMAGIEVPAQTYVVMDAHGVQDIGAAYQRILKDWMPASGYKPGDGPDFEFYGESFDPRDLSSTLQIYFPIVKA